MKFEKKGKAGRWKRATGRRALLFKSSCLPEIENICLAQGKLNAPVTVEELKKDINNRNSGKAAHVMGVTAEHLVLAEDTILDDLCLLINKIFEAGHVTDSMKLGLVTPVFKKKGSNTDSKN